MKIFFRRALRKAIRLVVVATRNSKRKDQAEILRARYPEYEFGRGTYGGLTVKH